MREKTNYIQAILGILGSALIYTLGMFINSGHFAIFGTTYFNKFLSVGMFILFIVYALGCAVFAKKKDKPVFYKAAIITLSIPVISILAFNALSLLDNFNVVHSLLSFLALFAVAAEYLAMRLFHNEFLNFVALSVLMPLAIVASGVIYKKMK